MEANCLPSAFGKQQVTTTGKGKARGNRINRGQQGSHGSFKEKGDGRYRAGNKGHDEDSGHTHKYKRQQTMTAAVSASNTIALGAKRPRPSLGNERPSSNVNVSHRNEHNNQGKFIEDCIMKSFYEDPWRELMTQRRLQSNASNT
ncbi:hypothetical protein L204_104967 [Cryptococcus depauperatus]|nr:hypothetical protein L204_06474 [Cryptococcus depauperatus CBS 7855]